MGIKKFNDFSINESIDSKSFLGDLNRLSSKLEDVATTFWEKMGVEFGKKQSTKDLKIDLKYFGLDFINTKKSFTAKNSVLESGKSAEWLVSTLYDVNGKVIACVPITNIDKCDRKTSKWFDEIGNTINKK